jgi:hypothetical protein
VRVPTADGAVAEVTHTAMWQPAAKDTEVWPRLVEEAIYRVIKAYRRKALAPRQI